MIGKSLAHYEITAKLGEGGVISPDGNWLGDGNLGPEITVAEGARPRLGKPRFMVEITGRLVGFDVDREGRILALLNGEDEVEPNSLSVILGWGAEIQGRLSGTP